MISRRMAGVAVPFVVGAVALTACGSSGSSGGNSSGNNSGTSGGKKSYTIACQGPLTGDNAALGINICNGVKLAVDQANSSGSLPFSLKYKGVDDQGSPTTAPAAAASEIGDSSVVAVVGPAFSGATQASEGKFAQAGLLSITASATLPTLTAPSNHFTTFYRAVATDTVQGHDAGLFLAKKLKVKKVYSVDDAEVYGQGLAQALDATLKANGVTVVHDSVPAGTKDYSTEASKVKSSGADAVYYSGYYADGGPFAKALHNAAFTGIFMSDDGTRDPKFVQLAGTAANNAYLSCGCLDATKVSAGQSFVSAYTAAFHTAPGTYSPEAYDVTNAVIQAMKGIGADITRAKLVAAAPNIDYKGITKTVQFNTNHELTNSQIFIYQVKNGTIELLGNAAQLAGS